jgi:exonuclease III
MFKIATWNVNSIRVRLEQVLGWPVGYRAAFAGEKTYNG